MAATARTNIPVVRVNSSTSSKYPLSYHTQYTQRSNLAHFETDSEAAATITPLFNTPKFNATTSLQIQSIGKSPISIPSPAKQLEIPIFSLESGRPVYLSIRPSRSKGSCRLVYAEHETETPIARTTYWFGLGRSPQVRVGRDDDLDADCFNVVGKAC
jgi:hypothetical protein